MTLVATLDRQLATVQTVTAIASIPGAEALAQVDTMKSTINAAADAEGIVWSPQDAPAFKIKALSRKYIVKHGG